VGIFDRLRGDQIKIHIVIRGPEGEGWQNVDTHIRVPAGTTIAQLVDAAETARIPLRTALANAPELGETMRVNQEPCSVTAHGDRILADGDQVLLAPVVPAGSAVDS